MTQGRWIWQWTCNHCGYIWQLMPSRKFPERDDDWSPTCPACGDKPMREWVKTDDWTYDKEEKDERSPV